MKVRTVFDTKLLERKVQDASFRSLGHASGAIRLTARRSIRRSKKPSKPGQPPHTPTGALKRVLRYAVDKQKTEAAIGPINEYARTIWNLHEFGGVTRKRLRLLKPHRFRVGEFGPIRKGSGKQFSRVRLMSEAQARRATQLVEQENQLRLSESRKLRRYPKRPFMGPALDANRARLPKFWQDSVRA